MSTKFEQLYSSMIYFKEGMKERWNLFEYHDPYAPAVFLGLYEPRDIQTFINHKGPKLLYFAGADFHENNLKIAAQSSNTICIGYGPDWLYRKLDEYNIKYTKTKIFLKSFDDFIPTPLGENIYVYKGLFGNRHDHYKWNDIVKPLQEVFGKDRVIYTQNVSLTELHEKYYNDSFVYIRPNPMGGGHAMFELGHMGRRTISNDHSEFSICSGYKDIYHMVDLIMEESKKIGTMQPQVADDLKAMFDHKGDWLNVDQYNWS